MKETRIANSDHHAKNAASNCYKHELGFLFSKKFLQTLFNVSYSQGRTIDLSPAVVHPESLGCDRLAGREKLKKKMPDYFQST